MMFKVADVVVNVPLTAIGADAEAPLAQAAASTTATEASSKKRRDLEDAAAIPNPVIVLNILSPFPFA
jgi:hypothetical protein